MDQHPGWHTLRRSLWPFAPLYGLGVALRNRAFDRGGREIRKLSVPVVSIGNLSVGGTGKTPLVVWLVEQLQGAGHKVGVLARGYGKAPDAALNDEGMLLERRFPGLPQVQDPDRFRGGQRLVGAHRVDVVLLDDGFQHRQLHRDLDIVCMDARRPFADGMLLPAGDLREPRGSLKRAGTVVLTRCDTLGRLDLRQRIEGLLRRIGRPVPVHAAWHRPRDVFSVPSGEVLAVDGLRGQRVVLLAGIARPSTFEATVADLGAEIADRLFFPDHHRFTERDVADAVQLAEDADAVLLTTEKDDVRLPGGADAVPRLVLRVDLEFVGDPLALPDPDRLRALAEGGEEEEDDEDPWADDEDDEDAEEEEGAQPPRDGGPKTGGPREGGPR